jgi:ABC-type Zn uptake system ZnuABC Zn-binding protein ZnuA
MNRHRRIRAATLTAAPLGMAAGLVALAAIFLAGCGSPARQDSGVGGPGVGGPPAVVAETSFLADIAQNVAGDRVRITSIVPQGIDPHSFEPTPQDAAKVARADAAIINSPAFEPPIDKLISGAAKKDLLVIDASAGLPGVQTDPHFWLDPTAVVTYVDNIRAGLTKIDAAGADMYAANAAAYQQRLKELDAWIAQRVATIPASRRLLVTNHESFGRFAARYGFTVVGTILPGADSEAAPSAQGLVALVKAVEATGAPALFLETGNNPDLARQLARETGIKVITDLYTHSLGPNAKTYIDMMHWNVDQIVGALK